MSVLILHRNPLEPFPYHEWLADYPGDVVILAAQDRVEYAGERVPVVAHPGTRVELLPDFFDGDRLRARALELAVEHGVRHVVAHQEGDIEHAAYVRAALGLDGAYPADVLGFRDKVVMKARLRAAGIGTAEYAMVGNAEQAQAFAREHGFPVVLKNRDGFNSIGLRILRDEAELGRCAEQTWGGPEPRGELLIETFVPGRMCHVDGLVAGGRTVLAWPSQYQYDLASFGVDPGARVDLTLDPDDPLTPRLLELTGTAVDVLRDGAPGRMADHAFHAEIFHTPDDRLVVCEIACRPGGAKVRHVLDSLFGVDLFEAVTRLQAGLPVPGLDGLASPGERPRPRRMAGQVLMMKRPGLVRSLPEPPGLAWVERFWRYAEPGETIPPAAGSADFLVAAVGSAPDRAECERRLRALGDRFLTETEIVELV
ncbi:acetyl-CoA carboxylase biotin carboxylase subunit family protein [Actinoplanes sp. NPDC051494]|uniref:acetyl-CoA carboxylase biotin carboxylase subunit family protein n=1 Tax=Actinoplanes sp. NPDC051494 TaxID=3363907 RepID=UPI0037AF46C5